jgi:ABC-2 type transport system permease protein
MAGALLYLRLTSLRNHILSQVRRLRQPKYVLGLAAAVFYFYFAVFRRFGAMGSGQRGALHAAGSGFSPAFAAVAISAGLSAVALLRIAYAWMFPAEKPGFRFSEAEIAFLFPAPIPRKALIHYRLLSAQAGILFTSLMIAVFFSRGGYLGDHRILRAVGWWIILSTFDLHLNGTNLFLSRLRETSTRFVLWRVAAVSAIAVYVVAVIGSAYVAAGNFSGAEDYFEGAAAFNRFTSAVAASTLFHALTLPFSIVFGPYMAASTAEFGKAIVPALLLLALHYRWVLNTEARFEEGSIAIAEKRAAVRAAAARGEMPRMGNIKVKAQAGPFPLAPRGAPEIAFLWKNLLSMRSAVFSYRTLLVIFVVLMAASVSLSRAVGGHGSGAGNHEALRIMIVLCSSIIAGYTVILGPQIARQDLRSDLPNIDLLKTYPMEGWRLALGELLAPVLVLSVVLWTAIIAAGAAFDPGSDADWLTTGVRLTLVACLLFAAPLLLLIQLIVPNTILVLFPGWYQATRSRAAGIEMFGQRLIFGIVQMLFALLVFVPAAGTAALVFFSSKWVIGISPAAVLSTLAIVPILAGEAAVGLWFLGERFSHYDLSVESR